MANRWPIASGNWSNSAIWSGSLIPTAADDVFTNNQVITIDQNIAIRSLQNGATGSAVAGGSYAISSSIAITASVGIQTGTAAASIITNGMVQVVTTGSVTISGSITRNGNSGAFVLNNINAGTITIIGNVQGPGQLLYNGQAVRNSANGTITVIGNLQGGSTSGNHAIQNNTNGTINVTGNVIGGDTGGVTTNGIYNATAGTVNVTGNVFGGPITSTFYGINNISIGTITVTGNVAASGSTGINTTTAGIIIVRGSISSSTAAVGVSSTSTTATNIFTGPFYNTGSFNAVYAYRMQIIDPASTSWRFDTEVAGGSKTLYTANQLPGVPRQNNVRKGVQYNFGLTGSLEMPDPTVVKAGVATDNTVGSAILTAQDMFDVLTQNIVQTGSIGETLDNVSTVQTVAATVSAFKV